MVKNGFLFNLPSDLTPVNAGVLQIIDEVEILKP